MAINFEKDEYVIFEVRKHWFTLFSPALLILVGSILPIFIYSIFSALPIAIESDKPLIVLFLFLYSIWILALWVISFVIWTDHYLDVWIITNKNLIDVEQRGIFHREITTTRLTRIQDINSEVQGMFQTFLNFGDLTIQNAGTDRKFTIKGVEDPANVRENIEKAISQNNEAIKMATL
ncbi:MAG: PH domain-containing protein [Candidatus Pacebacteria bacterium]|nr:PH domain-containing protein [Candidatus Paceibacterota bacterium]